MIAEATSLKPVVSRNATKDISATLTAFPVFSLSDISPMKAPAKGPIISPNGMKTNPIIIPIVENVMARFEPPPILVKMIGAT